MAIVTTDNRHYADIAAAIRAKSGVQNQYRPDQMAAAIEAIPTGGTEMEDMLVERPSTFTEYTNDRVKKIGDNAFYGNESLEQVSFETATTIGNNSFQGCKKLIKANLPALATIYSGSFRRCEALEVIDLPSVRAMYGDLAFEDCTNLIALVLRKDSVCTMTSANNFQNTQIASGTGYVYVPDDLVDQYKVATNWVTFAAQIKPISELPEV